MAKEPADRYPRCADFTHALRAALGLDPVPREAAGTPAGYVMVGVFDPSTRAVIRAALGRGGNVQVVEADNTRQLLEHAAGARPSLVLLDVALPGESTEHVCRELRAREGPEHLPVVALAARGHDDQWRAALAAGADDVLLRPFSAFQLLAKVRDHVPQALER
jgi:DNA-binding response OmpR family regulator